jgi:hypothetical protein
MNERLTTHKGKQKDFTITTNGIFKTYDKEGNLLKEEYLPEIKYVIDFITKCYDSELSEIMYVEPLNLNMHEVKQLFKHNKGDLK